jgi:hypothetical protein
VSTKDSPAMPNIPVDSITWARSLAFFQPKISGPVLHFTCLDAIEESIKAAQAAKSPRGVITEP